MNLTAALEARLSGRSDSEHEQAILRIVVVLLVTLYIWGRVSLHVPNVQDTILLTGLAGWLVLAIGIFTAIWIWPAANAPRRVLGMLADAGAITFGLFLAGESGVVLVGAYFFVIFGNGFRYGPAYLLVCQCLCLTGFMLVVLEAPWWRHEPYIGFSLIVWMIVLPLYVSVLVERINAARVKAEEAPKERVERERGAS